MTEFQREVRRHYRTSGEIAQESFEQSPAGRLLAELRLYANGRKTDIARGAESPALAGLMVEKYGYGLMKAADVMGVADVHLLTAEVDRLVNEIDPQHRKHQQYRWDSRPAGLSVTDADGTNVRTV